MAKKRKFKRELGKRRYKSMFFLAVEGTRTEPQYFALFNYQNSVIRVRCLKGNYDSSPLQVLKQMEDYLKKEGLQKSDQAWLVIDKDNWTDGQLEKLHAWSLLKENYGFALSNPKFELWLLLHFEDGNRLRSPDDCTERLKNHYPNYNKCINIRKFSNEMISKAVTRAKQKNNPQCKDWPRKYGTTVYRLVERILECNKTV